MPAPGIPLIVRPPKVSPPAANQPHTFFAVFEIFGTYNRTGATHAEATLSHTMQTIYGNFIRDPTSSPAPNWPRYVPGNTTRTLAKLAFNGNVELGNVVQAVRSSLNVRCSLLDFLP
jgi:hypothetical protein